MSRTMFEFSGASDDIVIYRKYVDGQRIFIEEADAPPGEAIFRLYGTRFPSLRVVSRYLLNGTWCHAVALDEEAQAPVPMRVAYMQNGNGYSMDLAVELEGDWSIVELGVSDGRT